MNNRHRSPSWGSAIGSGVRSLHFTFSVDASPAGREATDLGLKDDRGQREGRIAQIARCHCQFRNDRGWPVPGSWVFGGPEAGIEVSVDLSVGTVY